MGRDADGDAAEREHSPGRERKEDAFIVQIRHWGAIDDLEPRQHA